MKLDFIIIGGQKCGSTYIHRTIGEHPDIAMIPEECPNFESPDYENNGLENLKVRLNSLDKSKVIGIKRPNYLSRPEVPDRIYSLNPEMKIIVILRNPVERFKSAYFHQMANGTGPLLNLNEGTKRILNKELITTFPRSSEVLEFGFYGKYLQKYKSLFKENLLLLTMDDLKNDSISCIKKCYQFLEVDETFIPYDLLDNRPMKVNYSLQSAKFLTLANRFKFRYNHNKTRIFPKKRTFTDKIFIKLVESTNNLVFNKILGVDKKPKPQFSKEIKAELLKLYVPDIAIVEKLTSRDLSTWKI